MTKDQFRAAYRYFRRAIHKPERYGRTVQLKCGPVQFTAEHAHTGLHLVYCQRYRENHN
jgi:hypothetical protein